MEALTQEKIFQIMGKALNLDHPLQEEDSAQTVTEWDSFGHILILTAIDKAFEGKAVGIRDLAAATSVKKIMEILKREKLI